VRIPEHESLRNGLDGVAQTEIGFGRTLSEPLLFAYIDRDADEMRSAIAGLIDELTAGTQPDPRAIMVPHPEGVIDEVRLGADRLVDEIVELQIIGMEQSIDLAECEQFVACREP